MTRRLGQIERVSVEPPDVLSLVMEPLDLDEYFSDLFGDAFAQMLEGLDPEQLAEFDERLPSIVERMVPKVVEVGADGLLQSLHERAPEMLEEYREIRHGFEERLEARWGKAFNLSQLVMVCAREAGEAFGRKRAAEAAEDNDLVSSALVRLHARACRIAEEVLVLMRAGFGQAAMARWRALHEVAVVAFFIKEHGQETARRYFEHEHVEAWRGMREYQLYAERLGQEPFSDKEVQEARQRRDALCGRYGTRFGDQYGWANKDLAVADPSFEKRRVQIIDLEKAAGLDHQRPYYRMASHGVHANPKGITFNPDVIGEPILLAGASNAGLADPGHSTLISLVQVTASLLTSRSSEAAAVILTTLLRLTDEAGDAYLEAHNELLAALEGDHDVRGDAAVDEDA